MVDVGGGPYIDGTVGGGGGPFLHAHKLNFIFLSFNKVIISSL